MDGNSIEGLLKRWRLVIQKLYLYPPQNIFAPETGMVASDDSCPFCGKRPARLVSGFVSLYPMGITWTLNHSDPWRLADDLIRSYFSYSIHSLTPLPKAPFGRPKSAGFLGETFTIAMILRKHSLKHTTKTIQKRSKKPYQTLPCIHLSASRFGWTFSQLVDFMDVRRIRLECFWTVGDSLSFYELLVLAVSWMPCKQIQSKLHEPKKPKGKSLQVSTEV